MVVAAVAFAARSASIRRVALLLWGLMSRLRDAVRAADARADQLRRKLETDPARPDHILTVRKVGYRLRV